MFGFENLFDGRRWLLTTFSESCSQQMYNILFHLRGEFVWRLETINGKSFGVLHALKFGQERLQLWVAPGDIYLLFVDEAGFLMFAGMLILFNGIGAIAEPEEANIDVAGFNFFQVDAVDRFGACACVFFPAP